MGHPTLQVVFLSEGVVEMQLRVRIEILGFLKSHLGFVATSRTRLCSSTEAENALPRQFLLPQSL